MNLLKGSPRCGGHSDGIVDELSSKHSHLSSQTQFESESVDGDFDSIFSSQIFSMVLKWVAQASTFTVQPGVRSSRTRLAQRLALPLAPHFAQDIVTDIISSYVEFYGSLMIWELYSWE